MKKLILGVVLFSSGIINLTFADLGPKPSMKFNLIYETKEPITIQHGEQIECEDKLCLKSKPLENLGPQGFSCTEKHCGSLAYGYKKYQKLKLTFSDEVTRESQIFSTETFDATFDVRVTDTDLIVQETGILGTPKVEGKSYFWRALVLTLLLALITAGIFLYVAKKPYKILASVFLVNIITLPIIWLIFPSEAPRGYFLLLLCIAELAIFGAEGYGIYFLNKKDLKLWSAFFLSAVMNLVSFFVGGVLFLLLFLVF